GPAITFGARHLDHPGRDVESDRLRAARRERERDVAGACGEIERARARQRRGHVDEPSLPPPILTVRQEDRDEIVTVRDRRKQRAHVAALAFRRRDPIPHRHSRDNIVCMLPSSTVENYLKAIYQGQSALPRDERLVPMGQVATALGVTPGTATTMVKALAESGLAEYEPYSGVRLSSAGEKLAGLVPRRHRPVEP